MRGEGEVYRAPSHPLQALLGASQTAFCASPRQVIGSVSLWLMITTDNTPRREVAYEEKNKGSKDEYSKQGRKNCPIEGIMLMNGRGGGGSAGVRGRVPLSRRRDRRRG